MKKETAVKITRKEALDKVRNGEIVILTFHDGSQLPEMDYDKVKNHNWEFAADTTQKRVYELSDAEVDVLFILLGKRYLPVDPMKAMLKDLVTESLERMELSDDALSEMDAESLGEEVFNEYLYGGRLGDLTETADRMAEVVDEFLWNKIGK